VGISDPLDPEALQAVALAVAGERSVDAVLARIVQGVAGQPDVALARVWLVRPGDICETCRMRPSCPDQSRCLHLVASAGTPHASPGEDWSRLNGDFRRFPLGVFKVGRVGASGSAVLLNDPSADAWARTEWVKREGIAAFAGQPLVFRGEILGVLAVFRRAAILEDELRWLRTFADHAAVAIANGHAFAEIERLRHELEAENAYLREEVDTALAFGSIVGQSPALRKILTQLDLVARTEATVLILGESGTGKELVAREIHERSRRAGRPLIKVNCSAVPRDMFESEFFGHVRGAFTGAVRDRPGRFHLAHGGTIFLDEVGDLPLDLQAKLLRVLQEGQYERVGEDTTRQVDARVLAATNRDLQAEVRAGRFREDLYYRLSVFPMEIPPLRARKGDISALAAHFVSIAARRLGVEEPRIAIRDCEELARYDWPGNVRELQNVIERAVILSDGNRLRLDLVSLDRTAPGSDVAPAASGDIVPEREWRQRERANLLAALKRAGGRIHGEGGAAELLGIRPSTLQSRLKAFRISARDSR
jgi:transcriptional regulator with GAF, ATPase, and Fis domain